MRQINFKAKDIENKKTYKGDTYEERLIKSSAIDLRDNCIIHDLGNGFITTEPINKNKTIKVSKVAKSYIYNSLSYFDFLEDLFKGDVEYSLSNEEVAEVCYAIDKSLDEYMISNNEACGIDMSDYKTIKLDHDEYVSKWKNSIKDGLIEIGFLINM